MTGTVIKVTKSFTFDASHFLPNHKGKCSTMHGHTYRFPFRTTAENIAAHIFMVSTDKLRPLGVLVEKIKLWETPDSCAEVKHD